MKRGLRLLPLLLSAGILGAPALAQQGSSQSLQVAVGANNEYAKDVVSHLDAKIGSTMRYSLGSAPGAPLTLDVNCIRLHTVSDDSSLGYACTAAVGYFPQTYFPLHADLPGDVVVCDRSGEYCAESIFDAFVEETQPEKLKISESDLSANYAAIYQAGFAAGYEAGMKAGKAAVPKKTEPQPITKRNGDK